MRRLSARPTPIVVALFILWLYSLAITAAPLRQTPHGDDVHRHPQAQKLKNSVPPTRESIEAGHKLFVKYCSECHGDEGKGDGMAGEGLTPPPANLTDHEWKHGNSDGEIFIVIRDGTPTGMKKWGGKLTAKQIWDLVTFLRTIGPAHKEQ